MTLLERWEDIEKLLSDDEVQKLHDEIRRAIAIAQAVDEWRPSPPFGYSFEDNERGWAEADAKLALLRRAWEIRVGSRRGDAD